MIRRLVKISLLGALLFGLYQAASVYALFRFADHMRDCLPASGFCELAQRKAPSALLDPAMNSALACARRKQGTLESLFLRIPAQDASTTPGADAPPSMVAAQTREMCQDWGGKPAVGTSR